MEFEEFCYEQKSEEACSPNEEDATKLEIEESEESESIVCKKPRRKPIKGAIIQNHRSNQLVTKEFGVIDEATRWLTEPYDDCNFLIFGEIFCYVKSFVHYATLGYTSAPEHCYLNDFRPVIAVSASVQGDNMLCAQLDSCESLQDWKWEQETEQNCRTIDKINKQLRSLSDLNAYKFTEYLEGYKKVIQQYAIKVAQVHAAHNHDFDLLQSKIEENFKKSEQLVLSTLHELEQQYPNAILQFFVKKIDPRTLTGKTCRTGGNAAFIQLTCGTMDPTLVAYQFSRFGAPEVLDWKGIVDITMAQFTGNNRFEFDLQTLDGFSIPSTASFQLKTLSSFELSDDFVLSDVLETYVYDVNPQILECLQQKRHLAATSAIPKSDLAYTAKSEIFMNKFYPDSHQPYEEEEKRQLISNSIISTFNDKSKQLYQQEIQSDIFRINRQNQQKLF